MSERLFRGGDPGHSRYQFDAAAEGKRYGLSLEEVTFLWDLVRRQSTNKEGVLDEPRARARFAELAELASIQGGQPQGGQIQPAPGKVTQMDPPGGGGSRRDVFATQVPGKTTRVLAQASSYARGSTTGVPGRTTLVASAAGADSWTPADSLRSFRVAVRAGANDVSKLAAAIAACDHSAALQASSSLRINLHLARGHLDNALAVAHDDDLHPQLIALERSAEVVLLQAPTMSQAALDAVRGARGSKRSWDVWHQEAAAWRASRLGAVSSGPASTSGTSAEASTESGPAALMSSASVEEETAGLRSDPARPTLDQRFRVPGRDRPATPTGPAVASAQSEPNGIADPPRETEDPARTPAAIAAQGFEGAAQKLPFAERIQASFGRHDVSGIKAHQGPAAHRAAAALGADAYTLGSQIAFGRPPDLFTAAHEAAHTVHQLAGVQRAGGIDGGASDPYERHANEVARAVVAGKSAEPLLNGVVGASGGEGSVVQRSPAGGQADHAGDATPASSQTTPARPPTSGTGAPSDSDVAWVYFERNQQLFEDAIRARIGAAVPAHQRLRWLTGGIGAGFSDALESVLAGAPLFARLPELLYPEDPWRLIDQHRLLQHGVPGEVVGGHEAVGPLIWNPLAGDAVAVEATRRLRDSLARMVPRYLEQCDATPAAKVEATTLVSSHPMDGVAARMLCNARVVALVPVSAKSSKAPGPAKSGKTPKLPDDRHLFRDGIRFLQDYRWLGATDANLWNWIEVKDPPDALAEEVAATLWLDPDASQRAYGITGSAPFFRIAPAWARKFDEAKAHAPAGLDEPTQGNSLALAASTRATDAAITQGAGERRLDKHGVPLPPDLAKLHQLLDTSHRQLERGRELLAPWKLWELVLPALSWVTKYRDTLDAVSDDRLIALTPAIEGQQQILFEAIGAIQEVATTMAVAGGAERDDGAVGDVLRCYAVAVGESHLIATARRAIETARAAKDRLPIALLERSVLGTQAAVNELRRNEGATGWSGADADAALSASRRRVVKLRDQQANGQAVDRDEVDLVAADLKQQAVLAHARSLWLDLHELSEQAQDSRSGFFAALAASGSGRLRALPGQMAMLAAELKEVVIDGHSQTMAEKLDEAGRQDPSAQAWASRETARISEQRLETFIAAHDLRTKFKEAVELTAAQQRRALWFELATHVAVLIGVGAVGGVIGNVVAGAVRGAVLADAAETSLGILRAVPLADAAGALAGLGTDAAINAGAQTLLAGGSLSDSFVDNLVAGAAVRVALAPLHKVVQSWGWAEGDLKNLSVWERTIGRGKLALREGVVLTASMITGAATDYVVQRVRHGGRPDDKTAMEWALQGGAMAVGHVFGVWLRGFDRRLAAMAELGAHLKRRAARTKVLVSRAAETGDHDAALELLIERRELLAEEAKLLHELGAARIEAGKLRTLEAGNREERAALADASYSRLSLRFAGLTPDDASGRVWAGTTEDIAIALHQAQRSGVAVEIVSHDSAARQWRIHYNHEDLTIVETALQGQPRPAKHDVTDVDRAHAARYAQACEFLQERWEAKIKADIDARPVIVFDHAQIGYAFAGVVNQATLPTGGEGLDRKVVVYTHKGTLSNRGAQELGQGPHQWDAPGVRTSEQAQSGAEWATSSQLSRALDIGRLEAQTPAYQGRVEQLQRRPRGSLSADGEDAWKAPDRPFRFKVVDAGGSARWFYADRVDCLTGLGPGSMKDAGKVVEAGQLEPMVASNRLLLGDDPDYVKKLKAGRILVWGGSPTGAWAAEPSIHLDGTEVVVLGDTQPPADWPTLLREHADVMQEIASHPSEDVPSELISRARRIETQIAQAHSGMALRRNRKPGGAYEKPLHGRTPGDVQIDFGSPTHIASTADGRVLVTVGKGEEARTSIYDQVVIAHGQDPGAPGGPGGLLGPGAPALGGRPRAYGDVPEGTIAMRPIWGPRKDGEPPVLLGLESVDPPGIQLKGAAFASKRMIPWVAKNERAGFERAIDQMAGDGATTRDHGPISDDSRGVAAGVEVQRDRIPRANEVLGATAYRLPGPERTIVLDPDHPETWDQQIREYFAINLRANHEWVRVQRIGGGRSKAVVYRISVDGSDIGVFKLFDENGAADEQYVLQRLKEAHLTKMTPVRERGRINVDKKTGFDGAMLMDLAKGTSLRQMIEGMPTDVASRKSAFDTLTAGIKRTAEGLAEMHARFERTDGGAPVMMTKDAKMEDANKFLNKNFRPGGKNMLRLRTALGEADFQRVKAAAEGPLLTDFLAAQVPATARHGDANAGNFVSDDMGNISVIDAGSMKTSLDEATGTGTKTGAADIAWLLGSLETLHPGKLTPSEVNALRKEFMKAYKVEFAKVAKHQLNYAAYRKAERWYRFELEIISLKGDPHAKSRILSLLRLETTP